MSMPAVECIEVKKMNDLGKVQSMRRQATLVGQQLFTYGMEGLSIGHKEKHGFAQYYSFWSANEAPILRCDDLQRE